MATLTRQKKQSQKRTPRPKPGAPATVQMKQEIAYWFRVVPASVTYWKDNGAPIPKGGPYDLRAISEWLRHRPEVRPVCAADTLVGDDGRLWWRGNYIKRTSGFLTLDRLLKWRKQEWCPYLQRKIETTLNGERKGPPTLYSWLTTSRKSPKSANDSESSRGGMLWA